MLKPLLVLVFVYAFGTLAVPAFMLCAVRDDPTLWVAFGGAAIGMMVLGLRGVEA